MQKTILTRDGEDWLTLALDPFHDYERTIEGMPDSQSGLSFCRTHVQSITITPGAPLCRIAFSGFHGGLGNLVTENLSACLPTDPPVGVEPFAPVWVRTGSVEIGTTGTNWTSKSPAYALLPTTPTLDTPSRLIAIGLEVHDTTPKLYQQGSVACTRLTGGRGDLSGIQYSNVFNFGYCPVSVSRHSVPAIPATRALMALSPDYIEWDASRGIYSVPRMSCPQGPAMFMDTPGQDALLTHPFTFQQILSPSGLGNYVSTSAATNPTAFYDYPGLVDSGFDPLIIDFAGLNSANCSLRLTLRTIVEYFPTCRNGIALASATLSPESDPSAFCAYHRAISRLPAGVPVGMNPKGEYWSHVMKALKYASDFGSMVIPAVATSLGAPAMAGPAIGGALKTLNLALNKLPSGNRPAKAKQGQKKKKKGPGRPKNKSE